MNNEQQIIELLLAMRSDIADLKVGQEKLQNHLIALENELVPKVTVPFDAFELRGDQIENLKNHIDQRLDDFQEDITYLLSKVAKQEKQIIFLSKEVKQIAP